MLQSVYIHYGFDEPFDIGILKGWFLPLDVTATLKSLDVWGNFEVEPLASFFSNFGPNPVLECLRLHVDPEFHFDIDLSSFLHLQRISFFPGFFHAESIGGLIRVLSRLTAVTHVVELTFSIELRRLDGLRHEDVGPLDDLLSSEKFQYLEIVTILHDFRHPLRQLRQAGKEAFLRLSQCRILRFEVSE
ncbi:unnamed protein product [Somion occarium]|uniref:FBD domain-containing protein n=1 Tax=Somion occarium TaxID=3059160 RepID=A0ABP1DJ85_9APHY